jgi:hypothetical protein
VFSTLYYEILTYAVECAIWQHRKTSVAIISRSARLTDFAGIGRIWCCSMCFAKAAPDEHEVIDRHQMILL